MTKKQEPGLFGQKHSSRDYTKADSWGKNQFNSSFPASLVAYMYSKGIKPIYIKTGKKNNIVHDEIDGVDLFGIDPLSENAYYNYEAGFAPYEYYIKQYFLQSFDHKYPFEIDSSFETNLYKHHYLFVLRHLIEPIL